MMLGLSETVGEMGELFETIDSKQRLFRSRGKANTVLDRDGFLSSGPRLSGDLPRGLLSNRQQLRGSNEEQMLQRFLDAMYGDFLPLSIIVNEHFEFQYIIGNSSDLLSLPSGRPINDISKMVVKELAIPMSTGVQKVYRSHKPHIFSNIQVEREGRCRNLKMTIKPLPAKKGQETLVAVMIEEMSSPRRLEEGKDVHVYDMNSEAKQYLKDMGKRAPVYPGKPAGHHRRAGNRQ